LKNISPTLWVSRYKHPNSTNISTLLGVDNANINPSEGSPLAPRLISSGGEMERMPMPCAMGLALGCFQKILHQKGEF